MHVECDYFCLLLFEIGSHYIDLIVLELEAEPKLTKICLLLSPKCLD